MNRKAKLMELFLGMRQRWKRKIAYFLSFTLVLLASGIAETKYAKANPIEQEENGFVYEVDMGTDTAVLKEYTGRGAEIHIPRAVTVTGGAVVPVIGIGAFAFAQRATVTDIEVPESVTSIGEGAFSFCNSLASVYLPENVTTIGIRAFEGCDEVTIYAPFDSFAWKYAIEAGLQVKEISPIVTPTEEATATPTEEPMATPTEEPTATPTEAATATPTEEATATPTEAPTATPTEVATAIPTEAATAIPTEEPTAKPTAAPTKEPAMTPAAVPTIKPTKEPTTKPTTAPTKEPTAKPTTEPTKEPTTKPTKEPTAKPATEPAKEPTAKPAAEPTKEPAKAPTAKPAEEFGAAQSPVLPPEITAAPTSDVSLKVGETAVVKGVSFTKTDTGSVTLSASRKNVKKLVIPDKVKIQGKSYVVTKIADKAFVGAKCKTVSMGNNIVSIGKSAFKNCYKVTKISFSQKLQTIADSAFENCRKLRNVTISGDIRKIGSKAFMGCKRLKTVKLGTKKATTMLFAFNVFGGNNITKTVTPIKVSLGTNVFHSCLNLKKVIINAMVRQIGANTFYNCKKLAKLIVKSLQLKVVGKNALKGVNNCTITVPKKKYKPYVALFKNKGQGKKCVMAKA